MKKVIKAIVILLGLFILMNVVMFAFNICPPQGPWPMPPWCEPQDPNPDDSNPLAVKVKIITPYSQEEVRFTVNGETQILTRLNEVYAEGIVNMRYGDSYTISMANQEKDGIFTGGYRDYLEEAKNTGFYPWSDLRCPAEMSAVDEFVFDYLPKQGEGRPLISGFYTGMVKGNLDPVINVYPKMVEAGAGWVNIVPTWFFFPYDNDPASTMASAELRPVFHDEYYSGLQGDEYIYPTISDEDLKMLINEAHAAGLKVYLVPHINPVNYGPDSIMGKSSLLVDDIHEFFENYKEMIAHYAIIAEETGVELLGLGCENDSLTIQEQNWYPGVDLNQKWREIIDVARNHYNGKLTYSAAAGDLNYSAPNQIEFWDALDYIGFEWYLPITQKTEVSIAELVKAADDAIEKLAKPLYQKYGKPLLFTEVGFEAKPYAWARSYEGSAQDRPFDRLAAVICYEYLFQAMEQYAFLEGMFIWSWQPTSSNDELVFPQDMWWAITNDGNEVQHSIVLPQISKWFHYYSK